MDSVSTLLVILLGAGVVWMVLRAHSNSKHSPPKKHSGQGQPAVGFSTVDPEAPEAPRSRRSDGH